MEGRWRGVNCFVSQSYFIGGQCFNNLVACCSSCRIKRNLNSMQANIIVLVFFFGKVLIARNCWIKFQHYCHKLGCFHVMEICEIYIKWAAHGELWHSNGDGVEGTWGYQLEEKKKESSLISLLLVPKWISWLVDHCKHAHHQYHHVAAWAKFSRRIYLETSLCAKGICRHTLQTDGNLGLATLSTKGDQCRL